MLKRSFLIIFVFIFCFIPLVSDQLNTVRRPVKVNNQTRNPRSRNISVSNLDCYSTEDLVNNLLGSGVSVSNIQFAGVDHSGGIFQNGFTSDLGLDEGVILGCGDVSYIAGPNNSSGTSTSNGVPGDNDLDSLIPGYSTNDATILEFDFIPSSNGITFSYIFASEEYLEWVDSSFNDVFGFFLNGTNIALIPNTTTSVAINNLNAEDNAEYFINNDIWDGANEGFPPPETLNIEADGFTTVLTVEAYVNQGQQNHIRLGIADAGDSALDSWVFMETGSFSSVQLTALEVIVEGGVLQETDEDVPIDINVSAIGLNNADFDWVLSNPIWGNAQFIDRYAQEDRVIRYTPDPDYNGYDSFVCAVYDNLGHSEETVIGILVVHQNDPPQNTVPPSIAGDFIVGNEVTCNPGEWNDDVDNQHVPPWEPYSNITITYQWQRSSDSRNWEDIEQATEAAYLLLDEDAEHFIRCLVIAQDDGTGLGDDNTTSLASNEEFCELPISSDNDVVNLTTSIVSVSPNPFNPSTRIAYYLENYGKVKLDIFNLKGEIVRTLVNKFQNTGEHLIEWDGRDKTGRICSSGIYFSILRAGERSDISKLIMLK